ncbi:MAG: glycosyltransferase family 2 protein [Clostridia bacterium]|nr:glycosyltransferase family 2 protein [Clostridia bacterium]
MQGLCSVILPSFNEEAMIDRASYAVGSVLYDARIPYELIFVDDGSTDSTWTRIQDAATENPAIRGVKFSRNFGKEAAILAGLGQASGDCCVVIDCDMQHPPEKIVEMYRLWQQGYEVIEGQKTSRGTESGLHAFAAHAFYTLLSAAAKTDMENASDFKLLDRKAVDVLIRMPERGAFFRALSSWVGFKTAAVQFDVREREAGESKWSTKSLIRYALSNISSFTNAPLQFVTILGALLLGVDLIWAIVSLIRRIAGALVGVGTGIGLLLMLIGGSCMLALGVIGFYIGKIYDEIRRRPRYIIAELCGRTDGED